MEMGVHSWFKFFLGVVLNVQLGNPFDGCTVRRLVQSIKIIYIEVTFCTALWEFVLY